MRNACEIMGISPAKMGDLIELALIAFAVCFVVLAGGATIVLGLHFHYQHVDHMADRGYVLRSRQIGEGLSRAHVTEWVKDDTKTE